MVLLKKFLKIWEKSMARLIYATLILILSSVANAQQKCTVCPLEIDPVCVGWKCAAICEGESCEVPLPLEEACRLYNEQGINEREGSTGSLKDSPPTQKMGIATIGKKSPLLYHLKLSSC